jgi:hypothetical protein
MIIVLARKDNSNYPLTYKSQPKYIRIPYHKLIKHSSLLREVFELKRAGNLVDSSLVVQPNERATEGNQLSEVALYVDKLRKGVLGKKQEHYGPVETLSFGGYWAGVRTFLR